VLTIGVGDRGDAALERGRVRGGLLELFLAVALDVFKFYHHGVLSQTKWKCLSGDSGSATPIVYTALHKKSTEIVRRTSEISKNLAGIRADCATVL
jgi:hypothetical protein